MIKSLSMCGATEHGMEVAVHMDVIQDGAKLRDLQQLRIEISITKPADGTVIEGMGNSTGNESNDNGHDGVSHESSADIPGSFSSPDESVSLASKSAIISVSNEGNILIYSYQKSPLCPNQEVPDESLMATNRPESDIASTDYEHLPVKEEVVTTDTISNDLGFDEHDEETEADQNVCDEDLETVETESVSVEVSQTETPVTITPDMATSHVITSGLETTPAATADLKTTHTIKSDLETPHIIITSDMEKPHTVTSGLDTPCPITADMETTPAVTSNMEIPQIIMLQMVDTTDEKDETIIMTTETNHANISETDKKCDPDQVLECFVCQETFSGTDKLLFHLKHHFDSREHVAEAVSTAHITKEESAPSTVVKDNNQKTRRSPRRTAGKPDKVQQQQDTKDFLINSTSAELERAGTTKLSVDDDFQIENHVGKVCTVCSKQFRKNSDLKRHMRIHTGEKPFVCKVCDRGFAQDSALKIHSRTHSGELPYMCTGCGKRFAQKSALNVHLKKPVSKADPLECVICNEQIHGCKAMIDHMQTLHTGGVPLPVSGEWADIDTEDKLKAKIVDLENLKQAKKNAQRQCRICGKVFNRPHDARRHMRIHTGEKPYQCLVCKKQFSDQTVLRVHMRMHTGEQPYTCDVCGHRFSQKQGLNSHYRIHTGEKPYGCDICGKHFTHSGALKEHATVHTGERPFQCTICGKAYSKRRMLTGHMRSHTGETVKVCELCGKGFTFTRGYNTHMRTHTGEKPFKCDYCDKCFSQRSSKVRHMLIHTGDKPFTCETCGKNFGDRSILRRHRKVHVTKNVVTLML